MTAKPDLNQLRLIRDRMEVLRIKDRLSPMPPGWVPVVEAHDRIGRHLFGETWTGDELAALTAEEVGLLSDPELNKADEEGARRRQQAVSLFSSLITSEAVTIADWHPEYGEMIIVRREIRHMRTGEMVRNSSWGGPVMWRRINAGRYFEDMWVLVNAAELDATINPPARTARRTHQGSAVAAVAESIPMAKALAGVKRPARGVIKTVIDELMEHPDLRGENRNSVERQFRIFRRGK